MLTTSVIIPCHYDHFCLIPELLNTLEQQTVLPDEVVISISEFPPEAEDLVRAVGNMPWSFILRIIRHQDKMSPGHNRNYAGSNSFGELLICQDADDIPHPQRIEIIKLFFEKYKLDHLMHLWTHRYDFSLFENDDGAISGRYVNDITGAWETDFITLGNASFTREVFERVKWSQMYYRGEDLHFLQNIYNAFPYTAIIAAPLLCYRSHLSIDGRKTEEPPPSPLQHTDSSGKN